MDQSICFSRADLLLLNMAGESPKKKLILSENDDGDGDEDYDNERTLGECKLNLAPRKKKLLVFDLNGLLVYKVFCFNKPGIPSDRTPDGKCGNHLGSNANYNLFNLMI